jgi:hypothetical protein
MFLSLALSLMVPSREKSEAAYFLSFPRTGTTVVIVGRTASGDTGLGGDVSFLGFLTILLLFC